MGFLAIIYSGLDEVGAAEGRVGGGEEADGGDLLRKGEVHGAGIVGDDEFHPLDEGGCGKEGEVGRGVGAFDLGGDPVDEGFFSRGAGDKEAAAEVADEAVAEVDEVGRGPPFEGVFGAGVEGNQREVRGDAEGLEVVDCDLFLFGAKGEFHRGVEGMGADLGGDLAGGAGSRVRGYPSSGWVRRKSSPLLIPWVPMISFAPRRAARGSMGRWEVWKLKTWVIFWALSFR